MTQLYLTLETGLAVVRKQNGEWQATPHLVDSSPQCLAIDPFHPERIYCGTRLQGIWRSSDAGNSWEHLEQGVTQTYITSIAVSAVEQTNGFGVVYAGSEPSALFRSEDGGATWQELHTLLQLPSAPTWSFPPKPHLSHVRWITPDPHIADRVFVAIEAGALVRSHDGGHTWEDRRPGGPYDTHTLIMHPQAPNRLYSAAGDGFFTSSDGGDTWQRSEIGLDHHYLWSVAADPANPSTLVLSGATGPMQAHNPSEADAMIIYRRSGSGSWQRIRAGLPSGRGVLASGLAAHQAEPGVFYAVNNRGVYRSTDAGNTWESLPIRWPQGADIGWARSLVVQP